MDGPYKLDLTEANGYRFVIDTDETLSFEILRRPISMSDADFAAAAAAGTLTVEDVTGRAFSFTLRKKAKSTDVVMFKTTGSPGGVTITGVHDPVQSVNSQRVEVQIDDTDTWDEDASPPVYVKPGKYDYAVKRIDEGLEKVHIYGAFEWLLLSAREAP